MLEKRWKLPQLIICHILIVFLLVTFFYPPTRVYWEMLDAAFFKWINGSLVGSKARQTFWACANHRWADWLEDVFILGFFIIFVRSLKQGTKLKGAAQLLFCVLYSAAILYFVNRLIFRGSFIIYRDSPTLVIEDCVRLSKEITWMRVKDISTKCFPGDHAATAVLFASFYTIFAKWRLAIPAILYAAFLCMPRMIAGAHWLSDVLVGSGAIVLFFLSWAFCTPIHLYCIDKLEKFLKLMRQTGISMVTFFRKKTRIKA